MSSLLRFTHNPHTRWHRRRRHVSAALHYSRRPSSICLRPGGASGNISIITLVPTGSSTPACQSEAGPGLLFGPRQQKPLQLPVNEDGAEERSQADCSEQERAPLPSQSPISQSLETEPTRLAAPLRERKHLFPVLPVAFLVRATAPLLYRPHEWCCSATEKRPIHREGRRESSRAVACSWRTSAAELQKHQSEKRTLDRRGSGNPPCGMPTYPCRNSTTDWGKDSSSARSSTSALLRLFCTMNWARSPTILEDGVTWETGARGLS